MSLLHSVKAFKLAQLVAEWNPYPGHDIWDDLVIPATAVNPPGSIGPAAYEEAHASLTYRNGSDERADFVWQLPHGCLYGTGVVASFHMHAQASVITGGNSRWVISWRVWAIGAADPAWTTDAAVLKAFPADAKHNLIELKSFSLTSASFSTIVQAKVTRTASHGDDTLEGDLRVLSADLHIRRQRAGTRQEYAL